MAAAAEELREVAAEAVGVELLLEARRAPEVAPEVVVAEVVEVVEEAGTRVKCPASRP